MFLFVIPTFLKVFELHNLDTNKDSFEKIFYLNLAQIKSMKKMSTFNI